MTDRRIALEILWKAVVAVALVLSAVLWLRELFG